LTRITGIISPMGEFAESVVEEAALGRLESLGYKIAHRPA